MRERLLLFTFFLIVFFGGCTSTSRITKEQSVYTAILVDNSSQLSLLIDGGFSPNYVSVRGISLLEYAVHSDSIKSMKSLLSRGAVASDYLLFDVKSLEALTTLAEYGANLETVNDTSGDTLLIHFIRMKSLAYVDFLLNKSVDVNTPNTNGLSPIFVATTSSTPEILKRVIVGGANPMSEDTLGNYPIYYATEPEIIKFLLDYKYDIKKKNMYGENILGEIYLKAVENSQYDIVTSLLKKGVDPKYKSYGRSALDIAQNKNDIEMIKKVR